MTFSKIMGGISYRDYLNTPISMVQDIIDYDRAVKYKQIKEIKDSINISQIKDLQYKSQEVKRKQRLSKQLISIKEYFNGTRN